MEFLKAFNATNSPKIVHVTIQFDRIGEIDTMYEKYTADITIEATWEEEKRIETYNPECDFNPQFYIENIIQENKSSIRYKLEHMDDATTKITQIQSLRGVFWERLELQNFPLDIQELSILLTTKKSSSEIQLREKNTEYELNTKVRKTFADQQKWKLYNYIEIRHQASYDNNNGDDDISTRSIMTSHSKADYSDTPKLCATVYAQRQPQYYYYNAYFLIFLITGCSFCIFAIDCKRVQNRLNSIFTLILTSISFKWIVNRSLPCVSYLTSLDKYAIANIFFLCVVSLSHAVNGSMWDEDVARDLDKWLFCAFLVFFILIHVILFIGLFRAYRKIWQLKCKIRRFRKHNDGAYECNRINPDKTKEPLLIYRL